MKSAFYYDKGDFMPEQQDALVLETAVFRGKRVTLFVICDGIGGLEEGAFASSYVSMRLRSWFQDACLENLRRFHGMRRMKRELNHVLYSCNLYLQRYGERHGIRLGTTVTVALFLNRKYLLLHIGDSRAYIIGKKCKKLTHDTVFGKALCGCIGSFPWKGMECKTGRLGHQKRFLICSDGFWRNMEEREAAESLGNRKKMSEEQIGRRLHKLGQISRQRGEKDNQSAVLIG